MWGAGRPDDFVSYRDRVNPVLIRLQDPPGRSRFNDGEAGEHDLIDGVRNVVTGSGDDVVLGDAHANQIQAGAGHDVVLAGRGTDDVSGGTFPSRRCRLENDGHDRLYGGFGNDQLHGCRGNDRTHGGPGSDTAIGGQGNDNVIGGLGRDVLEGWAGNDILLARDGYVDRVGGGTGRDRARVDLRLDRRSLIERLF